MIRPPSLFKASTLQSQSLSFDCDPHCDPEFLEDVERSEEEEEPLGFLIVSVYASRARTRDVKRRILVIIGGLNMRRSKVWGALHYGGFYSFEAKIS